MLFASLYWLRATFMPQRGKNNMQAAAAATPSQPTIGPGAGSHALPDVELREDQQSAQEIQYTRAIADTLPSLVNGPRAVGWWGILFLVIIEVVVFSSLIASYFYLRTHAPRWPAGGIEPPELLLPTINTVILIASALPTYMSLRSISRGNRGRFLIYLLISMVMGIAFLVLKYVEYSDKGYNWSTNAYGSIVWTMTGLHIVHVTAVLLKSAAIWVVGARGYFNARRHVAVDGNTLYWYFVIIIWIPLYLTIYISPRLL